MRGQRRKGLRWAASALLLAGLLAGGQASAAGPYVLRAPVVALQPGANHLLGYSVAASRRASSGFAIAGALLGRYVVLLRLTDGPPAMVPVQQLASPGIDDDFGAAVALDHGSGQPLAVAVAANVDDTQAFNAGKLYFYVANSGGSLVLNQELFSPSPAATANYASSVALEGDVLAVGEPKAIRLADGLEVGAVHVYRRSGNSWILASSLYGSSVEARFGQSVALQGGTLAIGAALEDDNNSGIADTGAGFLYIASGNNWVLQQRVLATDRQNNDRMGISASIDGNTVVFGAGNDDKPAGTDAGSAYVFTRNGVTWSQQAKLRSGQPQLQERFGQSVSVSGDEIAVGAYCLSASGCSGPGATYVFARSAGVWASPQRLAPASVDGENFGHAVAHAGRDRIVVGAFNADLGGAANRGAVYLMTGADLLFYNGLE